MNTSSKDNVEQCETPFDKRHLCWFCGEPYSTLFVFPPIKSSHELDEDLHLTFNCPHVRLSIPSCNECFRVATQCKVDSIWQVKEHVKQFLIQHYRKDLAIGINWTQQSLAESQFEEGNFAGFQRSAWFMYEVAKSRVNYQGWPLVIKGLVIEPVISLTQFQFDGVFYPSVEDAISHYAKAFFLEKSFFRAVFHHLSLEEKGKINGKRLTIQQCFSHAVRFCRLLVGSTPDERKRAFSTLVGKV